MGDNVYLLRYIIQTEIVDLAMEVRIVTTAGAVKVLTPSVNVREDTGGGACARIEFVDTSLDEYEVSSIQLWRPDAVPFGCYDGGTCRVIMSVNFTGLRKRAQDRLVGTIRFCMETLNPEAISG